MERDFFRSLFSRCELRRDQDSCGPTVDLHSRSPRAHKTKARVFRGETAKYRMDAGDSSPAPPVAQFPRHPPVHDLHSIDE